MLTAAGPDSKLMEALVKGPFRQLGSNDARNASGKELHGASQSGYSCGTCRRESEQY